MAPLSIMFYLCDILYYHKILLFKLLTNFQIIWSPDAFESMPGSLITLSMKDNVYLEILVKKEHEIGDSLSKKDLKSMQDQPKWITEPGFHIGWDDETGCIVFVVHIR
jgi:hypothetical protein